MAHTGEVEMTAWCHPRGRKSASPALSSQTIGEEAATLGWVVATFGAKTLSLATLWRTCGKGEGGKGLVADLWEEKAREGGLWRIWGKRKGGNGGR